MGIVCHDMNPKDMRAHNLLILRGFYGRMIGTIRGYPHPRYPTHKLM